MTGTLSCGLGGVNGAEGGLSNRVERETGKVKRHAIRLTSEQMKEVKKLYKRAQETPVIGFGPGPSAASLAYASLHRKIHELALLAGLPEINGYYGADLSTGEFLEYE